MIFGTYPCCGGPLVLEVPDATPAYAKETCPHCGAVVWHRLSRIDPMSWTEDQFLASYEVDDDGKSISEKEHL